MDALDNKHETAEPSACDMFEELGYKKVDDNDDFITYIHDNIGMVMFSIKYRDILITDTNGKMRIVKPKEIVAINKLLEEMRWK
jgi:hypothetical protein